MTLYAVYSGRMGRESVYACILIVCLYCFLFVRCNFSTCFFFHRHMYLLVFDYQFKKIFVLNILLVLQSLIHVLIMNFQKKIVYGTQLSSDRDTSRRPSLKKRRELVEAIIYTGSEQSHFATFIDPVIRLWLTFSKNIFTVIDCRPRDLLAAKNCIPKFHFFGFYGTLKFAENDLKHAQDWRQG